ncbi:MAG: DUF5060 domain-containing protein [Planctomycetes bacterium]|nr:DUF5060 domain-containing protein [Planctomycetota bacterium]
MSPTPGLSHGTRLAACLCVLLCVSASRPSAQVCNATNTATLLGPSLIDVLTLPVQNGKYLVTLDALGLDPSPEVVSQVLASLDDGPFLPIAATVLVDSVVVAVPPSAVPGQHLQFMIANLVTTAGMYCFSNKLLVTFVEGGCQSGATLTGELREWHPIRLDLHGPASDEQGDPNPFRDMRLVLDFVHTSSGTTRTVQGFFAADGDAAETSSTAGDVWRTYFTPDLQGEWTWTASFRVGPLVAASLDPLAGVPDPSLDGAQGCFVVEPAASAGDDFKGRGLLRHDGTHWLRFAESGEHFLKGGADSPENLLAFADFDATTPSHRYLPHVADWQPGDPTWKGGLGKGLVGALDYLASKGMNSVYFLTFNVGGDGDDVWMWTDPYDRERFDVSKLDQWEIVFAHMDTLGIAMHVVTQETRIGEALGGPDALERRLYYRELVARFGHHLGVSWNLGEEIVNSTAEQLGFAALLRALDPYEHPIVVHTFPDWQDIIYPPLLPSPDVTGASLQAGLPSQAHAETLQWRAASEAAGSALPWIVCVDEVGPSNVGAKPDANDPTHEEMRSLVLWGNLMAGGAGVEWYFGYGYANDDLDCEDWRSRDLLWDQTRYALDFFHEQLPFTTMAPHDELLLAGGDYGFAKPGSIYAFYDRDSASPMTVTLAAGSWSVGWFDPEHGGPLVKGSVLSVVGAGPAELGTPPFPGDAVALLKPLNTGGTKLTAEAQALQAGEGVVGEFHP